MKKLKKYRIGPHCPKCLVRSFRDGDEWRCPECGQRFQIKTKKV